MTKIYFAMALHFHQPIGNFEKILDRAYETCYKPFIGVFENFPEIKMNFHFSGCLLDYFEHKHPEILDKINKMVRQGQVEIMTGGYYEPIFTSIPAKDRLGQIQMMSDYIKKRFHRVPQGIWIPERVWVPELVQDFANAGIRYSILDDAHFIKAGIEQGDLYGSFTAEYKGKGIVIFPSNKKLRYSIPFKMPEETLNYFREVGSRKGSVLFTYGDDGEKFGEWPNTHNWVYKEKWLDKFFIELTKNKDWVETVKLSEYLVSNPSVRKVHIPEASYEEMMEWSGGSWMNFLKKYPETNHMHKKMCYVSEKVTDLETSDRMKSRAKARENQKPETREEIKDAKRELYKGQCNCGYWHGVFGGIYLYHLRKAIYEHLINAEKKADEILHKGKKDWMEIQETDFYKNGTKVFIIENGVFSICIDPNKGGIIRELDHRALSTNLINTLARRQESYHKKLLEKMEQQHKDNKAHTIHDDIRTIDPKLKEEFFYDRHTKSCLIDHFIDKGVKIQDFMHCSFKDIGDFVDAPYSAETQKEKIVLTRKGKVGGKNILVNKEICVIKDKGINISYALKNLSSGLVDTILGIEFNITMPELNSERYNYFSGKKIIGGLNRKGAFSGDKSFSIKDSGKGLDIDFIFSKKPKEVWYFPVKTISQSERAYELNFQSSCIFPQWHIRLGKDEETKFEIRWMVA